jgi:starvation-inducible DNA-binding protein
MLSDSLKQYLASSYVLTLKAKFFHWNVTGRNFSQDHAFFDSVSVSLSATQDEVAEHIRALGEYAPGSLTRFKDLSIVTEQLLVPKSLLMYQELEKDLTTLVELCDNIVKQAEIDSEFGVVDLFSKEKAQLKKLIWQINVTLN